jgi:von Willebrand factor type A domain
MLNSAISGYVNFGGALTDTETTETVIGKLKSRASAATSRTVVGMSGSFIDFRLQPVLQTATEAGTDMPRIYYDPAKKKFVMATEGPIGIREFTMNASASENGNSNIENRQSVVSYARESTWVWDYGTETKATNSIGPTPVITTPIPVALIPATTPSSTPQIKLKLQPPLFSLPTGIYPISDFDLPITLSNHNPSGSSILKWSLNFGEWNDYTSAVMVPPNGNLRAQAVPSDAQWDTSIATEGNYTMAAGNLNPPLITLSSTTFDESISTIDVTINNPNGSGSSTLFYALKSPTGSYPALASYLPYAGIFTVDVATYPEGFTVQAYAKSTDTNAWGDSSFAEASAQTSFFDIPLTGTKILFVIDASSSMENEFAGTGLTRFEVVMSEMTSALSGIPASKKFGIAMFDADQHWLYNGGGLQIANSTHKQSAITAVSLVTTGQGTNYDVGLAFPLQVSPQPDQVVFLSDGEPSSPTSWHNELAALVSAGIEVSCVGIDCNTNAKANLDYIAAQTGGSTKYLDGDTPETNFSGFTEAIFGSLKGRSGNSPKSRLNDNNGHGNNYDGVDGSNPALIKGLLELEDNVTDDEMRSHMPKNSVYLESGESSTTSDLPNAGLFSGAPFSFTSASDTFLLGHFSYYNGDTIVESEVAEMTLTVTIYFESPTLVSVSLPITVSLANSTNKGDLLELAQPDGGSWPCVTLDGVNYELVPSFALAATDKKGKLAQTIAIGETGLYQLEAKLFPKI